ncbi:phosphoribosyltransferase [Candidatus Shapirobacteria bacterium CG03_land_8_20_14_0_80_40_19]|uniref:Phosphoribosyltransferase n=2 Tax=Candidatus Shapironibacteriota TaxID=1752721 RepID=A0A2M7BDM8_9BACT|nr:MAG: phosphoribosyltransferase [Candidatus Shapirobacteria bacterium CG03_land_8_20_14_0_80_40_19]PJC28584.1 MAG: phosphoribosyltransferase [Candidatus Shapirobacteria bacterium CG_4_9_14_0_2_um_filter_40_11]
MFKDRIEAGQKLAERLKEEFSSQNLGEVLLLAVPRGGIVVGSQISKALGIKIDCLVVKKIPSLGNPELAIGAIGEGGVVVWEKEICERLKVSIEYQQKIVKDKLTELEDKMNFFREGRSLPDLKGKTVIIIDDGVATGATVKVSVAIVENFSPKEVILAVPVIAKEKLEEMKEKFDRVVYLEAPELFINVGQFYENFSPISDEQIKKVLK